MDESWYVKSISKIVAELKKEEDSTKILILNKIRTSLHKISPFKNEPVDNIIWIESSNVFANDYNPNIVAPPEMELLKHSIEHDGYTQPVVTWDDNGHIEVVDGFHRTRVCKECPEVRDRVNGYLPIVVVNKDSTQRNDRIASTIRHNRARGKHLVKGMSDIVIELKRRNWSDEKIGKELGMDADEVLRLTQITGLAEMFKDKQFSQAWEANVVDEDDTLNDTNEFQNANTKEIDKEFNNIISAKEIEPTFCSINQRKDANTVDCKDSLFNFDD